MRMEDLPMEMRYVPTDMEDARIEVEDAEVEESPASGREPLGSAVYEGLYGFRFAKFWSDPDVIEQLS